MESYSSNPYSYVALVIRYKHSVHIRQYMWKVTGLYIQIQDFIFQLNSGTIFRLKKDNYALLLSSHSSINTCMLYWFTMGVEAISSFVADKTTLLAHKPRAHNQTIGFHFIITHKRIKELKKTTMSHFHFNWFFLQLTLVTSNGFHLYFSACSGVMTWILSVQDGYFPSSMWL